MMMYFDFLLNEFLSSELKTPHDIYRAIRAICRLVEEGKLELTYAQKNLSVRLEKNMRDLRLGVESFPHMQARQFIMGLRSSHQEIKFRQY